MLLAGFSRMLHEEEVFVLVHEFHVQIMLYLRYNTPAFAQACDVLGLGAFKLLCTAAAVCTKAKPSARFVQ